MEIEESETADFLATVAAKELDQPVGSGDIGPDRVRALSAIMCEIARPARGQRLRRMPLFFYPFINHRRSIA